MDEEFLLAINGDWDALLAALRDNRTLAYQTDGNGMTLLHWVCLHQDIPTEVLIKIVFANPHAVNVPNEAGHVPIDLAVQAECEERILEVLRAADKSRQEHEPEPTPTMQRNQFNSPASPYGYNYHEEEDMTYENPRYFVNAHHQDPYANGNGHPHPHQAHGQYGAGLDPYHNGHAHHHHHHEGHDQFGHEQHDDHHPHDLEHQSPTSDGLPLTMNYGVARKPLYSIYSGVAHPGEMHSKSLSLTEDRFRGRNNFDSLSVTTDEYNSYRLETASDSQVLRAQPPNKWPKGTVSKGTSFPPRWKQSRSCHVCASRFTLTHRRHHCRNCGFSVCNQHSTNRVALPKFGLGEPQRVCDKCFLAGRHLFGLGSGGGGSQSGGGAVSVASGSEHPYDPQQFGGRRDSFGSFRP